MRGSQYWEDQDLKQLAGVMEALPSIASPSFLRFASFLIGPQPLMGSSGNDRLVADLP